MDRHRIVKLITAAATSLALLLAGSGPAGAAEGDLSGEIAILLSPTSLVLPVPPDAGDPCPDHTGYVFAANAVGLADEGTLQLVLTGKSLIHKPGGWTYDKLEFSILDQALTYANGPSVYDVDGTIVVRLEVFNINNTAECLKEALKCTFAFLLVVEGTIDTTGARDLPFLDPGVTASLAGTTNAAGGIPLTYISGDGCVPYSVIAGSHVEVDLNVLFTA